MSCPICNRIPQSGLEALLYTPDDRVLAFTLGHRPHSIIGTLRLLISCSGTESHYAYAYGGIMLNVPQPEPGHSNKYFKLCFPEMPTKIACGPALRSNILRIWYKLGKSTRGLRSLIATPSVVVDELVSFRAETLLHYILLHTPPT